MASTSNTQQSRGTSDMAVLAIDAAANARDTQADARAVLVAVIAGTMADRKYQPGSGRQDLSNRPAYSVEGSAGPDRQR